MISNFKTIKPLSYLKYNLSEIPMYETFEDLPDHAIALMVILRNWAAWHQIDEIIVTDNSLVNSLDVFVDGRRFKDIHNVVKNALCILQKNNYIDVAWDPSHRRWVKLLEKGKECFVEGMQTEDEAMQEKERRGYYQ